MAKIDKDGYIYIVDRKKDMLIVRGMNVYPREVEEVIIKHHSIREVAVIGIPDEKWGEAVKAVVSLKTGQSVSEEEIIRFCKDHMASYKKPRSVDFIDELPKNNYGKVMKRELRAKYWRQNERQV